MSESTIPIICDVSPDPNNGSVINDALKISNMLLNAKSQKNENSDFNIYKYQNWSLLMHSREKNKHIHHIHNDYGSPILNYKNNNIILVLGRPTYIKSNFSNNYTGTKFHSVPQIECLEQSPRSKSCLLYTSPSPRD